MNTSGWLPSSLQQSSKVSKTKQNFTISVSHLGSLVDESDSVSSLDPTYAWLLLRFWRVQFYSPTVCMLSRLRLKCDGTRAETRFRLSAKRTSPFKPAGGSVQSTISAEVCASGVVMLDTPCSEVVWRVLATHSIRQFPLHFPSRASPYAITFQLDSNMYSLIRF